MDVSSSTSIASFVWSLLLIGGAVISCLREEAQEAHIAALDLGPRVHLETDKYTLRTCDLRANFLGHARVARSE